METIGYGYVLEIRTTVGDVAEASLPAEVEGQGMLVRFGFDAPDDSGARLIRDAVLFAHDGEALDYTLSRKSKSTVDGIPQWDVVATADEAKAATA